MRAILGKLRVISCLMKPRFNLKLHIVVFIIFCELYASIEQKLSCKVILYTKYIYGLQSVHTFDRKGWVVGYLKNTCLHFKDTWRQFDTI